MAQFVRVPPHRLQADVLNALLEEFVSRDGTDYGLRELTLAEKVQSLQGQLLEELVVLLYDSDSEEWDLVPGEQAELLLNS